MTRIFTNYTWGPTQQLLQGPERLCRQHRVLQSKQAQKPPALHIQQEGCLAPPQGRA